MYCVHQQAVKIVLGTRETFLMDIVSGSNQSNNTSSSVEGE